MRTVNNAGFIFYWPEGSPFVEVFREFDHPWAPFEVINADDLNYSLSALNRLANESKEYAHGY
jgi:hypothetical protein